MLSLNDEIIVVGRIVGIDFVSPIEDLDEDSEPQELEGYVYRVEVENNEDLILCASRGDTIISSLDDYKQYRKEAIKNALESVEKTKYKLSREWDKLNVET